MNKQFFYQIVKGMLCLFPLLVQAQQQQPFSVAQLFKKGKVSVFNRKAAAAQIDGKAALTLDEQANEGIAWINGLDFSEGSIEIDLKGKDEFQRSFLGIAFHGLNDSTYDAVYFRPFNFRTPDSVRHIHAVQYISHPVYTWKKLREEKNALYEKAISPAPDPNQWFHARIVLDNNQVLVYVNGANTPSLVISKLNNRWHGKVGLWVGDGAGGTFANLKVTKKK